MLQQQQIELIHREIDGATTPDESAAARKLVAEDPEARALDADLRRVGRLFQQVGSREPPIHPKQNIMAAVARSAPASPNKVPAWSSPFAFVRWSLAQLKNAFDSLTEHTEMAIMTKKTMIIGSTIVATVVVVAAIITGFPPTGATSGTIGGPGIAGVQQASRYQGRPISPSEVTLSNPEISVLLQNPEVLKLVTSESFRTAMASESFRTAMASESFRTAMASEAFRTLQASEAFRSLARSASASEAFMTEANRTAQRTAE